MNTCQFDINTMCINWEINTKKTAILPLMFEFNVWNSDFNSLCIYNPLQIKMQLYSNVVINFTIVLLNSLRGKNPTWNLYKQICFNSPLYKIIWFWELVCKKLGIFKQLSEVWGQYEITWLIIEFAFYLWRVNYVWIW